MVIRDNAGGLVLAGRFQCQRLLKQGRGVDTWLGVDLGGGGTIVVKTLAGQGVSAATTARFEHEAQVLRRVSGPSLQPLLAGGREGDVLFLVQRFVEGVTLRERLASGPLTVASALTVGIEVGGALQVAHDADVLHLDVKPANVIVDEAEPVGRAVLIDFGLARSAGLDASVRDEPVGTARYLAPEAAGLLDVAADERADLYSLGVVLFESLAGRPPFEGTDVGEVLRQHLSASPPALRSLGLSVPRALEDVVARLLAKNPGERYQSAGAVVADLVAIADSLEQGVAEPPVTAGFHDQCIALSEPAFVGRTAELATLDQLLADAGAGQGGLVVVEAESGGGKTRLLDELALRSRASAWILRGQGADQAAQRPFQLLDGMTRGIVASTTEDPAMAARLRDRLEGWAVPVVAALPGLAGALGQADTALLGPEAYGEVRNIEALRGLFDALGEPGRPALVLLDDCQWADGLTARLLARWQERAAAGGCHVLVVAAFRSEEVGPGHALRAIPPRARLALGPFTADDVRQLCGSMAGELPREAVATVIRLAEGSPFMASAVLRGMVECGALRRAPSGWEVHAETLAAVQTSRRAALFLVRRLELLSPDALALLSVGAVVGKEFDLGLVTELTGQRPDQVEPALDAANRRHILWVDRQKGRAAFSHDKLREALLDRLGADERRELHRRAARRIEEADPGRVFELAYHYDAGGEGERALGHALRAAELARGQNALEVASAHYRMAERAAATAAAGVRAGIAEGLGDVLILQGVYGPAVERLETALSLAVAPATRARLEGKLGDVAFKRGEPLAARRWLEGALRQLGRRMPRRPAAFLVFLVWEVLVQAAHTIVPSLLLNRRRLEGSDEEFLAIRLYSRLAYVYWFHSGKIPCGWAHLREMNLAERYPPTLALAQAYSEHAPVATMIPWYARGIAYARRSLAIRTELGDLWGQGQSLHFYGVVLYAASRYRECIDQCREAIRLLQRTGDRWEEHTATWHLAFAHYRLGELDRAVELARHVHASALEIDDSAAAGISLSGWSRASEGRIPADLVKAELDRHGEDAHTATEVHVAEAVRLLGEGQVDDAVVVLEAAVGIVRRAGLRQEYVAPVWPWLATARRLQAEAVPAYAASERLAAVARAAKAARRAGRVARSYRNNGPHALRERALVAALTGRTGRAHRLLARSLALAEAQGARYEAALTQVARAHLDVATGGTAGATGALAQAEAAVASLVPRPEEEESVTVGAAASLSLTDRFAGLLAAGRAIAAAPSQEAVYGAVRRAALTLLRGERCHLVEVDDELAEGAGDLATVSGEGVGEVSRSLVAKALATGGPVMADEGSPDVTESMVLAGVRSSLCAPIRCDDRVVACFVVTHRGVGHLFGDDELALAEFVATLAGATLEHVAGSEARYRSLALHSSDVVTIVDAGGVIRYQSSSVARVFGYEPVELVGRPLTSWVHPDDAPALLGAIGQASPGAEGSIRVQCRRRHSDGSWRHVETMVTNLAHDPGVRGVVVNTRDVTERVELEAELRNRASHDPLTGLANRALFTDRVNHALARQSRQGEPLTVLFLDLDDFKSLNDTMGHAAGDLLLEGIGRRLEGCVRPGDTVARFGGDEFAVLLEEAGQPEAERITRRIIETLARPVTVHERSVLVRASVGVAVTAGHPTSVDELLANADSAMYVAKSKGKDRYEVFEPGIRAATLERSGLRTDLAWALERGELDLHYQPVMDVAKGSVVGFEALLRWQHPQRGLLAPAEFIPLAEASGLIVPIGAWVLGRACEQAQAWQDSHPGAPQLTMAVNVSPRQLQDPGLVELVAHALALSGLDPSGLVLEITESATVSDTEASIQRLHSLKRLGVGLAIDDFGTGYSSLTYLRRFPVDMLKIDRSFVAGMAKNPEDAAIVSHVVGLAHVFGLKVVAEGVETVQELEELTRLGCDYAQGYKWRRPSPFADVEPWLHAILARPPNAQPRLRVLVADDREAVRIAVRIALEVHGGFVVVAEAEDGHQAVELAGRHRPDLVVLDVVMPGQGGLAALPGIRAAAPGAGIVLLTAFDADVPVAAMDQTLGLFDKTDDLTTFVDHLAEVTSAMAP
jgi:diguanylate cyclase (GGDEF)-like protein/PAS domain S-box-containing protein